MGIRNLKSTTPGSRFASRNDFAEITKHSPEKKLTSALRKTGGRNNRGRITSRHIGGGHKRRYRIIDFKRDKFDVPAKVSAIEYDPNRSANIALLFYADGEKRYIIAPSEIKIGDEIVSGENAPLRVGNTLPLGKIATGMFVHNIELIPGCGGKMARSAGSSAQVMAHESGYTLLRLPSGEMRRVLSGCSASIGQVSNVDHKNEKLGKAGRNRHRGRRPTVRGSVMSPAAHPHGGGEGRSGIGMPGPKTPWGKPALGKRTRRNKSTSKYILRRRYG